MVSTHSVRMSSYEKCPCIVKIPTPGTWPSIFETVLEPLDPICQGYVLSWLLYHQQAPTDVWLALSVYLFKPSRRCSWLANLPYMDLLDRYENVTTAVPDAMIVGSVKAKACFCSNNTEGGTGMFIGISDCDS